MDLENNDFKMIKDSMGITCKNPKLSPQRKNLVWVEADLLENLYPGPHAMCFRMVKYDLESKNETILVDVKENFDFDKDDFAGIYLIGQKVPEDIFVDEDFLLWNTVVDGNHVPMLIDVKNSTFKMLSEWKNHTIFDQKGQKVLLSQDDPLISPQLKICEVNLTSKNFENAQILNQPPLNDLVEDIITEKLVHTSESGMKFSSIYIGPAAKNCPLIVWPHGGPHSIIPWAFSSDVYYLISQGFACLLINYRGSIAQGNSGILSLPGKVGENDVKDCIQAYQECKEKRKNVEKAVLFGGSHGGFLVTHLMGQYPDTFEACIARNPVINISTMATVSDIGDWTFNEAGIGFGFISPTPEEMKIMYGKSPIAHVDRVKNPVFLMIGKDDLRVPHSQGMEYYHNLKALGKPVDMNLYEDNHPLGKVHNHANVFINTVLFFKTILGIE